MVEFAKTVNAKYAVYPKWKNILGSSLVDVSFFLLLAMQPFEIFVKNENSQDILKILKDCEIKNYEMLIPTEESGVTLKANVILLCMAIFPFVPI